MARTLDAAVQADISNSSIISVALLDLYFDNTTISFTTSPYNITVDSVEYLGVGNLGEIQPVEETTDIQGLSMVVLLSGINTSIIPIALAEHYQGRRATINILFLEEDGSHIGTPVNIFDGRMDYMNITLGQEAYIEMTLESKFVEWERTKASRYNSVDQRDRYPNDKGLDFVESIENTDIPWGI